MTLSPFRSLLASAALIGLSLGSAQADGRLKAEYTVSFARIPVGAATLEAEITAERYSGTASGHASAALRVLSSGKGTLLANGTIADGKPMPAAFTFVMTSGDEKETAETAIAFDAGLATVTAKALPSDAERIAVTEAHRRNVMDPLSALIVSGGVNPAACERTLPVFDGRRRFDLKLAYKRLEPVKTAKGYMADAVVCAVTFEAVAGHRPDSTSVKYLTGREIEIWFAPVAGTTLLAPFRLSAAGMLGNVVVQAHVFETTAIKPAQ